jgi:hypothetical protein
MHQNPLRPKKDLQLSLDSVLNQKVTPARESLIVGVTHAVSSITPVFRYAQKNGIGADYPIGFRFAVTSYVLRVQRVRCHNEQLEWSSIVPRFPLWCAHPCRLVIHQKSLQPYLKSGSSRFLTI